MSHVLDDVAAYQMGYGNMLAAAIVNPSSRIFCGVVAHEPSGRFAFVRHEGVEPEVPGTGQVDVQWFDHEDAALDHFTVVVGRTPAPSRSWVP